MQLNIKDAETVDLARRIASRRGASLTEVVKVALKHEDERDALLAKPRTPEEIAERLARIHAWLDPIHEQQRASGLKLPTDKEMDEWMYDEDGLPR